MFLNDLKYAFENLFGGSGCGGGVDGTKYDLTTGS